jgi:hypothetical protein
MPEYESGSGFFLNAEEIEFGAELAMIAALCFFQAMEIFVELLLVVKSGSVNSLELWIPLLTFPVGSGNTRA